MFSYSCLEDICFNVSLVCLFHNSIEDPIKKKKKSKDKQSKNGRNYFIGPGELARKN